jgi:hypothetical protein
MRKLVAVLLLSLSATLACATERPQVFEASTTGDLLIDAEGRVAELAVDRKELGDEVMAAVEQRIRSWRFEPMLVDGRPTAMRGRMRLNLLAERVPGEDGLTLAIRHVHFFDADRPEYEAKAGVAPPTMTPPMYPQPLVRLNVGAMVLVAIRLDDAGRVVDAASQSVELRTERADAPSVQQSHARALMRATERAARDWIIPAHAGEMVVIPVKFTVGVDRGRRWQRIHDVPVDPPAWVLAEQGEMVRLSEGGEAGSSRIQLRSAIN